jgi:hypothetical protein
MANKIIFVFGLVIVVLILSMGIVLLSTHLFTDKIPYPNRTFVGIVFILYALFRGYRAKQQYGRMKREEES